MRWRSAVAGASRALPRRHWAWSRCVGQILVAFGLSAVPALSAQVDLPQLPQVVIERFVGGETSYLGVRVRDIDEDRAKEKKLKEARGVEVTDVDRDSPAEKAGIKPGDVILEFNGYRVESVAQFVRLVRETPPGRRVELKVQRDGQQQTLSATLERTRGLARAFRWERGEVWELPDLRFQLPPIRIPDMPSFVPSWRTPRLGIVCEELRGQLAEYFGVSHGVLVREVAPASPAERAGLRAGDVITHVNGRRVDTPRELSERLREAKDGRAKLTVVRNRKDVEIEVELERRPDRVPRQRGIEL